MKDVIKDIKKDITHAFEKKEEKDAHKVSPIPELLRKNKKIAIITEEKVEDIEFFYPYYRFTEEGYDVDVITCKGGAFEGKNGIGLKTSKSIHDVYPQDYELLYLPGGKAPQKLREDEKVLKFVRDFAHSGKIIAAVCHGPQILIAAGLVKGKTIAAWMELKEEVEKAGAKFADEALQIDGQFITSRMPGDLHRHLSGVLEQLKNSHR